MWPLAVAAVVPKLMTTTAVCVAVRRWKLSSVSAALEQAGAEVRDPVWRLPFWTPYEPMIEPGIADLRELPVDDVRLHALRQQEVARLEVAVHEGERHLRRDVHPDLLHRVGEDRVRLALEAAAHLTNSVRPPFTILTSDGA